MLHNLLLLTVLALMLLPEAGDPRIDPHLLVTERNISTPIVFASIHECALVVHVSGSITNALVKVQANGVEVGKNISSVGEGDVKLTRPLVKGEQITATQTVSGVTSDPTDPPVPVDAYPALTTPVVSSEIYACGRAVPVSNLITSTRVQVTDASAAGVPVIGTGETAAAWFPVATTALVKDHGITALQTSCPNMASRMASPVSTPPIKVKASPPTVPKPKVDQDAVIVEGSEVIVLHGLLPGAEIEIWAGSTVISNGYIATAADNWFPLSIPVPSGNPKITAVQTLCTPSMRSDPVTATDVMTPPVIGSRICASSHFVAIDKTVLNANVTLFRRRPSDPTPISIGYSGAVLGSLQMPVNKTVTLNDGDKLTATQTLVTAGCGGDANVVTQHNDNFRTGAYLAETVLTPSAVLARHMQQRFRVKLNGSVLTQSLYVREVRFTTGGANGIFAGTDRNSFYALNAQTGTQKWRTDLQATNPTRYTVPHGVETTPVIDVEANRIYILFSAGTSNKNQFDYQNASVDSAYWLVALDLRSGAEVGRVKIAASALSADGKVQTFVAKLHTGHAALLLDHGSIYTAFGSEAGSEGYADYLKMYHGWVLKYRAADLTQQAVFCTSPNLNGRPNRADTGYKVAASGIWQGGGGLAADPDGNVYLLTGNGRLDYPNALYGDSIVKLSSFGKTLVPTPFMPATAGDPDVDVLEISDSDLGSGGPLIIPGTNMVIGGGKTGWMYLLDRTAMAFQQRITAATNTYAPASRFDGWDTGPHLHGSPTFWQGTGRIYVWGEKDYLHSFPFNPITKKIDDTAPGAQKGPFPALPLPMPGAAMSLSANGNAAGSAILWAIVSADNFRFPDKMKGRLFAFDAGNLKELWNTQFGTVPHMAPPTIADGRVYVSTSDEELVAYELGIDGNNLNWTPYIPKLSDSRCQSCHTETQVADLQRRHPWGERFENEAMLWILPARALQALAPPKSAQRSSTVEGNGERTYTAVERRGALVWQLKDTTADLVETGADGEPKAENAAKVRLAGGVWTAADGSRVTGVQQKTVPSPSAAHMPWGLFRASAGATGMLSGVTYVECVYTHAGQPPAVPPTQRGQVSKVGFVAQYWFYK